MNGPLKKLDEANSRLERPYKQGMDGDQILEEVNTITDKTAKNIYEKGVAMHESLTEENAEDVTQQAEQYASKSISQLNDKI